MSRKLFTAGCVVLIVLGLVHLLGHYHLTTSAGETDQDRQLLALMRGNGRDMGLGMVRSTFDILTGFSLAFSVFGLGMGLAGFVVWRHERAAAGLLRRTAIVYAGTWGVVTAVTLRYFFWIPLAFVAAAFLLFAAAVATAPKS